MADENTTPELLEEGPEAGPDAGALDKRAQNWAMLCHLSSLIALLGVPFGNLLGPLVVWLLKRAEHPSVDKEGKESLNFQLSMTIYMIISALLILVAVGVVLVAVVVVADVILVIIASVKVSNGRSFRYPITIRFIK